MGFELELQSADIEKTGKGEQVYRRKVDIGAGIEFDAKLTIRYLGEPQPYYDSEEEQDEEDEYDDFEEEEDESNIGIEDDDGVDIADLEEDIVERLNIERNSESLSPSAPKRFKADSDA